ncbi:MAG: phytoene desaturase, partial [Bacteroidia bacterium]|nr:phytoene desaturase [Bacteroidia bacterium]
MRRIHFLAGNYPLRIYRFDMGPSVFTMPEYVDELITLSGKNPKDYFNYVQLDPVYRYFFEDGTVLDSFHGKKGYAKEMAAKTKVKEPEIINYLDKTEEMYELTAEVFLHNSLHKFKNFFTKAVAKGLINFGKIGAFDTMNGANEKAFKDPHLVQIFNRYSTYNGSSPYLAPATLNVIPHVEIVKGAYYPIGGMYSITSSLVKLGKDIGIDYRFDMGPSVFTMPEYVDELITLSGKNPKDYFNYVQLDPVYRYFFED